MTITKGFFSLNNFAVQIENYKANNFINVHRFFHSFFVDSSIVKEELRIFLQSSNQVLVGETKNKHSETSLTVSLNYRCS
jgi:hypothetical protein